MIGRLELPLAAALGALHAQVFVHTGAWLVQLLCVALLAWRVQEAAPRRAALLGWVFGSAWVGTGTWWLFVSMHRYGGLPAPLAVIAVVLLALAMGLYLGVAMGLFARWRRGRTVPDALLWAALWLLAELGRGVLFTGFPWLASGYAQVDAPLAVLAPWVGVYGIGAAAALLAALPVLAARAGPRALALALAGVAVVLGLSAASGPAAFTLGHGTLRVSLVQTNVAQDEKFAVEHLPGALAWLRQALMQARGDLVVAPETAIPLLPSQLKDFDPRYWDSLRDHFEHSPKSALIGVPLGDFENGYTNSVLGVSSHTASGAPYRYDKVHLVPFGEFIPAGLRWFTNLMQIPLGDFDRGPLNAPSFNTLGQRLAPNICYEDLFGEELAQRFQEPTLAPTVFVNLSNIGWFGPTVALPQHLNISRMRALEFQIPMLRSTNTGITAVIDEQGRVTAQLPAFTRGTLDATVQAREGVTPFAWWAAHGGLWPLLLAALGTIVLVLARVRRA
ncbi:apolipoprotein N-acyltransferase [Azohydromonas sp. G-1-1-14]|uniref:Apolipoprotein N-acyltransferase n=1 Tax=Azohydromonas caseinilytica TaxID=2728836 RepID=A0A848F7J4_9BURK|nr:apolipoprotein N-acyltransferase [Azohydromonas caseinilytica]